MAITMNDLTVYFGHLDQASLLEDWIWLIGPTRFPILVTALGDAFLQDAETGEVLLLLSGTGEIQKVCNDIDAFRALLEDHEFVSDHFVPGIVVKLRESGAVLGERQLCSFKTPPVLGGAYSVENLEPIDIAVHFSVLGQVQQRASNLPDGTPVDGVEVS